MNYKFIQFGPEGFPLYYYDEITYPPVLNEEGEAISVNPDIPKDAHGVTDQQWDDARSANLWLSPDGKITVPPAPKPIETPEPVVILPAVTLWERTSKTEAAAIEAAMETQDPRSRNIFRTAQTFRSDHELWPLLEQLAMQLFGEQRAAELLAP
ncbi:hypothetical protein A8A54_15450 [Brucella pseudogrignonensis]|uniref:hypothetical protein n=1 Tax=Brucella pseudogrignonensis TaxID=419475 RepID=UPI0007DA7B2A|nr:hypothetical protein [Brucella pseudogrignonensis]ANG97754.1 hypothetical protein A8A54_15450 [Brucella pseudogrignonensis]